MKNKMPNEITIIENTYTLDMYNDRGSFRIADICKTNNRANAIIKFDLNAVNGTLSIQVNEDKTIQLSAYQLNTLIEFLSQGD